MGHRTGTAAPPGRPQAVPPWGAKGTGTLPGAAVREAAEPRIGRQAQAPGVTRFVHNSVGHLLGQANHALFKGFENVVREAGLGALEWRVLATLSDQPPMAVGCLAREVLSQQPTVTKLLQRLAVQGWVRLKDDPQDQRRTLVGITATGQKKVSPLIEQALAHEALALTGLSATEVKRLKEQLRRLASTPTR